MSLQRHSDTEFMDHVSKRFHDFNLVTECCVSASYLPSQRLFPGYCKYPSFHKTEDKSEKVRMFFVVFEIKVLLETESNI